MQRLDASDAQMHWMASKIPSDQFLLYCFDGVPSSPDDLRRTLVHRCAQLDDLSVRIAEVPGHLDYPYWAPLVPSPHSVIVSETTRSWTAFTELCAGLFADQVDPTQEPWRLHLFFGVTDAPRCHGPATVAILQISHALADGRRASNIARSLFGTGGERITGSVRNTSPVLAAARGLASVPYRVITTAVRSRRASILDRALARAVAEDLVPPPAPSRARTVTNTPPDDTRDVRMIVCDADDLKPNGVSVTVGALTAMSVALTHHLHSVGMDVRGDLGAEVTIAGPDDIDSRNNFRNVGVSLHPDITDLDRRAAAIAASLAQRRARADHPVARQASAAQRVASNSVPAFLTRWGVSQFDAGAVPDTVTGNTVVSSVARGAADLELDGAPVRFTAGFPGLSPVMGITHGVHGIGDTVTVSVTSSRPAVPDPDAYADMLRAAVAMMRAGRAG